MGSCARRCGKRCGMAEPARKVEIESRPDVESRPLEGGPPRGPVAINPRFVRLLCKLYREWEKDQDPSTWTSEENA